MTNIEIGDNRYQGSKQLAAAIDHIIEALWEAKVEYGLLLYF